jgi:hypothetical protein
MGNYLGARSLLAREDEGYVVGVIGRNGQYLPGKAAKWHASERLMGWIQQLIADPIRMRERYALDAADWDGDPILAPDASRSSARWEMGPGRRAPRSPSPPSGRNIIGVRARVEMACRRRSRPR